MPTIFVNGPFKARGQEKISDLTGSTGFTATKYKLARTRGEGNDLAEEALVTVETASIRWTCDGTTPTVTAGTGIGHLAAVGDSILITGYQNITKFRAINEVAASGAAIQVTYNFKA